MEYLPHIISGFAVIFSIYAWLRGSSKENTKEQGEVDKDQNEHINRLEVKVQVLETRLDQSEKMIREADTKVSRELEKLEKKIDAIYQLILQKK